jgi:hypothetical protein
MSGGELVDIGGDELHRVYQRVCGGTPEEWNAVLRDLAARLDDDPLADLAGRCAGILTAAGFPDPFSWVHYDNAGRWWPVGTPALGKFKGAAVGYAFAERLSRPLSDEWYAARICGWVHLSQVADNVDFKLRCSFAAGEMAADWRWRRTFKPDILTGKKQRHWLSEIRRRTNERATAKARKRRQLVAELALHTERTGGALVAWLKRELAERGLNVSDRTIRRDLQALQRPKKVGQPR